MLSKIEKKCVERGMKMTEQRKIIAKVISDSPDHPDVEEVHQRAIREDTGIGIATVYRTLRLLDDAGIVEKHDFGDGRARYEEILDDHHDHLINVKTGEIIEFVDDEIEKLQEAIAKKYGFKLIDHRLELYVIPENESN